MFVPCPHCGFLVALIVSRVGATQRCPRCHKPLQASADAAGDVADADADADAEPATSASPVATTATADEPATAASPDTADGSAATTPASTSTRRSRRKPTGRHPRKSGAPTFARRSVSVITLGPRWPGLLAIVALVALLALQLLLAQREQLATSARWRPTVAIACELLHCDLPPWREPTAFTMLDRQVQPAPGQPGVLLVAASFRNDARWPQPWPRLLVRLSDSNGQAVAQGMFAPAQYRGDADAPALLAPGQSASVRFTVREPPRPAVAFNFQFRSPSR